MVNRNPHMAELKTNYLFPEINKHKKELLKRNPDAKIIDLGIGNTTLPLTLYIANALTSAAKGLSTKEGYSGYGDEQGMPELREKIAETYYKNSCSHSEVFVSDGAKCDIARLQIMFGRNATITIQNPVYPAYFDSCIITGHANKINYFECTPENNFFPDLEKAKPTDIIFFCSPNNPTGATATRKQLKELVDFAKDNKSIIIFDSAYRDFIRDSNLPKSIFEIPNARDVSIEVGSFSKSAGFTGVRLGWTIIPEELEFKNNEKVSSDWNRIMTTIFNGASNIAQKGGLAALDPEGMEETRQLVDYYMGNAKLIRNCLEKLGLDCEGGLNSPYVWAKFLGKTSWESFTDLLEKANIVTTPGSGFGSCGEGFLRFSAFGQREQTKEAVERLSLLY